VGNEYEEAEEMDNVMDQGGDEGRTDSRKYCVFWFWEIMV
jgi:hypothetical protein